MGAKASPRKRATASKGKGKEQHQPADVPVPIPVKQENPPAPIYAHHHPSGRQDATGRMESIQEGSDSEEEVEGQLLRARLANATAPEGIARPAVGRAKKRAEMAKTSRLLKNRLALACFKVGRGWESVGFERIESQYGAENGQSLLTEEANKERRAKILPPSQSSSSHASSFPASHPAPPSSTIASSVPTPSSSRVSRARTASQVSQQASPKLTATSQARPQIQRHNSLQTIAQSPNASPYATASASPAAAVQPNQAFQHQYTGHGSPSATIQPVPMSAPASITTFSTGQSVVDPAKKPRQRRESYQPKSATKRAATTAPDGESSSASSHKRKPSQNTLWQNSRAILGTGIGGGGGQASLPASPVKPSVLSAMTAATPSPRRHSQQQPHPNYAAMQQASQEIYSRTGSPGQPQGIVQQTPRRGSAYQTGGGGGNGHPPGSAPHSVSQHHQYIPHQSSNLNPSPAHHLMHQQHISAQSPNTFVSPQYQAYSVHATPHQPVYQYTQGQTPHQATPQSIQQQQQQQHQLALATSNPDFSGSIPQYATTDGLAAFSYPMQPMQSMSQQGTPVMSPHNGSPFPMQHQMLMQQQQQQMQQAQLYQQNNDIIVNAGRNRSQSGLSRTPSDLSYAGSQPPQLDGGAQLSSSQDSSSLDTNLSAHLSTSNNNNNRSHTRPSTANNGADQESAAELMLFLAHSPSPKQATKKSGQSVLGGDLKGRRLFGSDDDLAGNGNGGMGLSNGGEANGPSQSVDMAFHASSSGGGHAQQGGFAMNGQLQNSADLYSAAGDLDFSQQLDQPFEFQQVGGPGEPFHFSQYSLMDGQAPLSLGQDYGSAW